MPYKKSQLSASAPQKAIKITLKGYFSLDMVLFCFLHLISFIIFILSTWPCSKEFGLSEKRGLAFPER